MTAGDPYVKIVEWSERDGCFVGSCPELFYGGCHGSDPRKVFDKLCRIVRESVQLYKREKRPLPPPMRGKDFVNAMQRIAG